MNSLKPRSTFLSAYRTALAGNEKLYVSEFLQTTGIATKGKLVSRFEKEFTKYSDIGHANSATQGTPALHLTLPNLGIDPGDEVIFPTLTYIASVNAKAHAGAEPVAIDLKSVYHSVTLEEAEQQLGAYDTQCGEAYPSNRAVQVVQLAANHSVLRLSVGNPPRLP